MLELKSEQVSAMGAGPAPASVALTKPKLISWENAQPASLVVGGATFLAGAVKNNKKLLVGGLAGGAGYLASKHFASKGNEKFAHAATAAGLLASLAGIFLHKKRR